MESIVNIAKTFEQAEKWDVLQPISMTPDERLHIARELQKRVHGPKPPDVREWHRHKSKQ